MCGRSLCRVKGWKSGLRRRYALREGPNAVAVGMGALWRQQWPWVGRAEVRHALGTCSEREELAEGVRVRTGEFYAGGDSGR